jgi:hypothetical protein
MEQRDVYTKLAMPKNLSLSPQKFKSHHMFNNSGQYRIYASEKRDYFSNTNIEKALERAEVRR